MFSRDCDVTDTTLSSRKTSNTATVNEIKLPDKEVTNASAIADAFNSDFTSIGERLASNIDSLNTDPTSYIKSTNTVFSFNRIETHNVARLLETINSNKATGLDGIPGRILRLSADVVSPSLTKIFNQSLIQGIYPDDWKIAKVIPVFKNGARNDLNNYGPISIISAVAKIFGKLVHDQLLINYCYLTSNDLLSKYQSGFRPNHSTLTALLETTNSWCVNIDNGLLNGVVFIDLKKAFDTTDHNILLIKLKHYGVDDNALTWFHSYLNNKSETKVFCQWELLRQLFQNSRGSSGLYYWSSFVLSLYQ